MVKLSVLFRVLFQAALLFRQNVLHVEILPEKIGTPLDQALVHMILERFLESVVQHEWVTVEASALLHATLDEFFDTFASAAVHDMRIRKVDGIVILDEYSANCVLVLYIKTVCGEFAEGLKVRDLVRAHT
jgi:hypothetical protein